MKIEDQVCSLELSKKLLALGVKQDSYFFWVEFRNESSPKEHWKNVYAEIIDYNELEDYEERSYLKDLKKYSAFTVAELGAILPGWISPDSGSGSERIINFSKSENIYCVSILNPNKVFFPRFISEKEADARATMLIYLKEKGYIK